MSTNNQVVRLRNGSEELLPIVQAVMTTLEYLSREKPVHLFELYELARDPSHKLFGQTGEDLAKLSLISKLGDHYTIHDSTRNVIMSAVRGDGFDLSLGSPL